MSEVLAHNPAILASGVAIELIKTDTDQPLPETVEPYEYVLNALEHQADRLNFLDNPYWVRAGRGMSLPVSISEDKYVGYADFYRFFFRGTLVTYSRVQAGQIGGRAINALCMAFDRVIAYPLNDLERYKLPKDHLLHVPVLSVDTIDQTDWER